MPEYGLDIEAAASVLRSELYGDWYRDPWGWPEFREEFARQLTPEDLGVGPVDGGAIGFRRMPHFQALSMPKMQLGTRPAVDQDPASRIAYTAAALAVAKPLHRNLSEWVFGWRFRDDELSPSTTEWAAYQAHARRAVWESHSLQTDITSYFASLDVGKFAIFLEDRIGNSVPVRVINQTLSTHDALAGRRGFPQRSSASALLANVAMGPIDDAMAAAMSGGRINAVRRWMDDISAEGDKAALFRLFLEIQAGARQVGLELNASKTGIFGGDEIYARLQSENRTRVEPTTTRHIRAEYVDEAFSPVEHEELLELEDELLNDPDRASRGHGKLALRSLREYEIFDRLSEWVGVAERLPHLADSLSRYFADARLHNAHGSDAVEGRFLQYVDSPWSRLDWARAQLALSFSSDDIPDAVVAILWDWLESATDVQSLAVATQRLASRDPGRFRAVIRQRVDSVADPLTLRVFGLGLVTAGDTRAMIRSILRRSPYTAITLKYLEFVGWRLPASPIDFDRAS